MLRIREVEERIAAEYAQQEMRCPTHLSVGQEAVAAGFCAHLRPTDWAVSGHRAHAHYLAKGGSLEAMLAEIYGKATGCCGGKGGSMHLVDLDAGFLAATPIVASTIPIGVGAAFSAKRRGEDRVVAIFLGEAATEEGTFHEAINFAALHRLNCVFVCENNLYSVYTPLRLRQPDTREVRDLAHGHGVESLSGDGNDVLEVSRMSARAIERARSGSGPVFLELSTYRWREHCGPNYDNDIGYRTVEEFEEWRARDPMVRSESMLRGADVEQSQLDQVRTEVLAEIDAAFEFARTSPFPEPEAAGLPLYA
jgi:pyruvate dehydrogenase E1 component alpha subunit